MIRFLSLFLCFSLPLLAQLGAGNAEISGSGDFDGDGNADLVIVDRMSGQYRIAYQDGTGAFNWSEVRASGVDNVTDIAIGKLLDPTRDALAFTSPSANRVVVIAADNPALAGQPQSLEINALGTNALVALDLQAPGNSVHDDLLVASQWNDLPNNGRLNFIQSDGTSFTDLTGQNFATTEMGMKLTPEQGHHAFAALMERGTTSDRLQAFDLPANGVSTTPAFGISNVPMGSTYTFGNFGGSPLASIVTWIPGDTSIRITPLTGGGGSYGVGTTQIYSYATAVESVNVVGDGSLEDSLLIIHDNGYNAKLYAYDGMTTPNEVQNFDAPGSQIYTSVPPIFDGRMMLMLNDGNSAVSSVSEIYSGSPGSLTLDSSDFIPTVYNGAAPTTLLLFENEPFVSKEPNLQRAISVDQWSTSASLSGSISVTTETFGDSTTGMGSPQVRNLGPVLANENFALVNQYRSDVAVSGFSRAFGSLGLDVAVNPGSGNYNKAQMIILTANDPSATIYYRTSTVENWQTYNNPFYIFKNTDLWVYARQGTQTSPVKARNYRFKDGSGNLDSDGDSVPDVVEIAMGLDPTAGMDSDGDGFSDLEELVLGSHPDDDGSTPGNWPPNPPAVIPPRPSLEQQASFNLQVTPNPRDGALNVTASAANDVTMEAFDHAGNNLSRADIGAPPAKRAPALWFQASALETRDGKRPRAFSDVTGKQRLRRYGKAPNFNAAAFDGLGCLDFDDARFLRTDASLTLGDFTLFMYYREIAELENAQLLEGALNLRRTKAGHWNLLDGEGDSLLIAPFPAEADNLLAITRQGKRLSIYRNGQLLASRQVNPETFEGQLKIGGFEGGLAELVLYDTAITPEEAVEMQNYLLARFGKIAGLAHLNNITTNAPVVVATSPLHYDITTTNSDTLIGRELVRAVAPPAQAPVTISYSYGGGTNAAEAAAWVAAAQSAYTSVTRETISRDMDGMDTLTFALLERKIGIVLHNRGLIDSPVVTLLPNRAADTTRLDLSTDDLKAFEARNPGTDNGFKIADVITQIEDELATGTDPNLPVLKQLVEDIYDTSSELHNTPPRSYRLPLDVIRDLIALGSLDQAYVDHLSVTQTQLANSVAAVQTLLGNLSGRNVTTFTLEVTADSFTGPCLKMDTVAAIPVTKSLWDGDNKPYQLLKGGGLTLVEGIRLAVTAYTDSNAIPCDGEDVIEVISAEILGRPVPPGKRNMEDHDDHDHDTSEDIMVAQANPSLPASPALVAGLNKKPNVSTGVRASNEPQFVTRYVLHGVETDTRIGNWFEDDTQLIGEGGRGIADYTFSPEEADRYRLQVQVASEQDAVSEFNFQIWIDENPMGRFSVEASYAEHGTVELYTPFLPAGDHQVRILWDDVTRSEDMAIVELRLQERLGEDEDGNGVKDWVDAWLYETHYVDRAPMLSQVSPAVVEGFATDLNTMRVNGEPVEAGLKGRFFARVELDETDATTMRVRYQNGAAHEEGSIQWMPTNLLEDDQIIIRKGDALLLTAFEGSREGRFQIKLGDHVMRGKSHTPLRWRFNTIGKQVLHVAYQTPTGRLVKHRVSVTVTPSTLEDASLWVGNERRWDLKGLPNQVVLEADSEVALEEVAYLPKGGRRTHLFTEKPGSFHVVARLGEDGPILDSATVEAFEVYTANDTYVRLIEEYADGAQLIEIGLIANLPQGSELRLSVIAGGITFDDGTASKTLRSSDFNELGQTAVRFNRSANAKTAVCHITEAYQGFTFVGTVKQLREER